MTCREVVLPILAENGPMRIKQLASIAGVTESLAYRVVLYFVRSGEIVTVPCKTVASTKGKYRHCTKSTVYAIASDAAEARRIASQYTAHAEQMIESWYGRRDACEIIPKRRRQQ